MKFVTNILLYMWWINTALSLKHSAWERVSALACAINLSSLPWNFESEPGFYTKICNYEPAFESWSYCIHEQTREVADESTFVKSLNHINQFCSFVNGGDTHSITLEKYYASLNNASRYIRNAPTDPLEKLWYPVEVNPLTRRRLNSAYHSYLINFDNSDSYALWLLWYFVFIMAVNTILMIPCIKQRLLKSAIINRFRGRYLLPTLTQTHAAYLPYKYVTGLVPTRLESILLLGFTILHGFLLFYNYKIDPYNIIFRSHQLQWFRQIADRSGILSFAQFPLIIIFSTRNSILEHFTGFKYTTSIVLHKWIGRTMILDALIHGIAYGLYARITGTVEDSKQETYWKMGVLGIYVMIFICILSLGFLRRNNYETFLYLHIVLAVIFFYCCWTHVKQFGWEKWINFSVAFWILERLLRLKSILRFGVATAELELIRSDLFKVIVPRPSNWPTQPAQYVFIYFLQPFSVCWQSHPFTFIDLGQDILIVIRAKQGATQCVLRDLINKGGRSQVKVLIEGPYGVSPPLMRFEDSLLLCGGSGIPGPLAHALKLGNSLELGSQRQNVHIVIINRGTDILEAYIDQLVHLKHLNVDLQIHITGCQKPIPSAFHHHHYGSTTYSPPDDSSSKNYTLQEVLSSAKCHYGRPNVNKLIEDIVAGSTSLAICCCGPPAFVDSTRNYVADTIKDRLGNNRLDNDQLLLEYFEEYQTW